MEVTEMSARSNKTPGSDAAWDRLQRLEKLALIQVDIPPFDIPAISAAKNIITGTRTGGEARNLAIVGVPGVGKSTVAEKVVEACRGFLGNSLHAHAILELRLASKASISSLAEDILNWVGDPHFARVEPAIAESRVITLLRGSQVKIVVIDEAHHLLHGKGVKGRYYLAESLKNISDMAGVIFIFVGTPSLMDLAHENKQFARRLRSVIRLLPFDWCDQQGRANLLNLLQQVDEAVCEALGFRELAGLGLEKLGFRVYQALSGVPGVTIEFIIEAAKVAVEEGAKRIELEHLQTAFGQTFGSQRIGERDPFAYDIPDNWKPVSPGLWFEDHGAGR
jgi:hypothetical protein